MRGTNKDSKESENYKNGVEDEETRKQNRKLLSGHDVGTG